MRLKLGTIYPPLTDTTLSLVLRSPYPLINTGDSGSFVFNFTLPATPELQKEFNFAHRPQAHAAAVELPYELTEGKLRFGGTATVTEASPDAYEVFMPVTNGDFNKLAKETSLKDLTYETIEYEPSVYSFANEAISFTKNEDTTSYAEYVKLLEWDNVFSDTNSELIIDGLSGNITGFESKTTATVEIRISAKFLIEFGINPRIVMMLNGVVNETFTLAVTESDQGFFKTLSVVPGDRILFYFHMYPTSHYSAGTMIYTTKVTGNITGSLILESLSTFDASIRYPEINYARFPLHNPSVFDNWSDDFFQVDNTSVKELYSKYFQVINYYKTYVFPKSLLADVPPDLFNANNLTVVFPYIAYIIKRILYYFNFAAIDNPFEDELQYAVLVNHYIENEFQADDTKFLPTKLAIDLKDHVPDMNVDVFLKNLCNLFGLGYEVDPNLYAVTFSFVDDIITSATAIDITSMVVSGLNIRGSEVTGIKITQSSQTNDKNFENVKPLTGLTLKGSVADYDSLPATGIINDCWLVTDRDSYYVWSYDPDLTVFGWVFKTLNFTAYITAGKEDGATELATSLGPCVMRNYPTSDPLTLRPAFRTWVIPSSSQPGQMEGAPELFNADWSAQLLWYHGLLKDSNNEDYPFASNDVYDPQGSKMSGVDLSLRLGGTYGLYAVKWQNWVNFRIAAKTVVVKILPDVDFISNFRFKNKLRINGVDYLPQQYSVNITKDGFSIGELTLLTC